MPAIRISRWHARLIWVKFPKNVLPSAPVAAQCIVSEFGYPDFSPRIGDPPGLLHGLQLEASFLNAISVILDLGQVVKASVVGLLFTNVMRHIDEHVADVLVSELIENLLGLPVATHQPCTAQQSQVMADERLRKVEACRDVTH